ncbi:exodeoxyribonuclease VII large subunit [Pseudoalteromonas fenneropenaei]|uniref:Exodeoxyribonuclease 7 large subunit n=1 Tax=Pseudoalteromonas fenneropenaei TaxID=1737459 RepID=A0ABV7CH62_9GAMM
MQPTEIYSVSKLNRDIRSVLEQGFASLRLTGEISNFIAASSGHWYFSLKDDKAQVKAAMWRGNNRYARFRPENGAQVLVHARISVYEPRGEYQLIVEHIEPAGEGLLKQQFEALKMRLAAEGLFATAHKKPIPNQIHTVGVITSPTGAAIRDILTVLKRRAPQLAVVIYPCLVQGQEAAAQIAARIALANQRNEVDVLLVGRGGGSLEDLWCFNEELVARAIFASRLPIISAVGHEIDTTIADYVADLRAPTPSAAAELVCPDQSQLLARSQTLKATLLHAWRQQHHQRLNQLANLRHRLALTHPQHQLRQQQQQLDELTIRLQRAMQRRLEQQHAALARMQARLQQQAPHLTLLSAKHQLSNLQQRLSQAMQKSLKTEQQKLAMLSARLDSISPLQVLARGYSISKQHGKVIKTLHDLDAEQTLVTELLDGQVTSTITSITPRS